MILLLALSLGALAFLLAWRAISDELHARRQIAERLAELERAQ